MKVVLAFLGLFAFYHLSELVGTNDILVFLVLVLFLPVAHFMAKFLGEKGVGAWGLQRHGGNRKNLLYGFSVGFLFYLVAMIVSVRAGRLSFTGHFSLLQVIPLCVGMIVLTFFSSISEDILTRGFLYRYLAKKYSPMLFVLLSSLIYTLNHIWDLGNGWQEWLRLFLLGLALSIPLVRTGSLWFTVGCHWGWNVVSIFKDHIGDSTDLKIVDQTTEYTYILTIAVMIVFNLVISKYLLKSDSHVQGE